MGQSARGMFIPAGTHVLYGDGEDFRTRAARFLVDPVLPAFMVVVIGVLTVAIIVLLVTTIATTVLHNQPEIGNVVDPWFGLTSSSAVPYGAAFIEEGMDRTGFWASSRDFTPAVR